MSHVLRMLVIGVMLSLLAEPAAADSKDATPPAAEDETQPRPGAVLSDDAEKTQLQAASSHVGQLKIRVRDGNEGSVSEPIERPLLAFGDPARTASRGTLWAFGTKGRPDAFMKLWQGTDVAGIWYQSLIRAGDHRLLLRAPDGRQWRPPDEKVARTPIDKAEPPTVSRPGRLRQLKSLARRFTAYEVGDPDRARSELRLLVQPVHRYDDADHALQDGAAFVFAHGTNPELILLIEAAGATIDQTRWQYSLFPSSSAELHAALDGREVWLRPGAPGVVGRPTDDYWLFSLPAKQDADTENAADAE